MIPLNMSGEHPFQQLFETFGKLPAAHSDSVNGEAREALKGLLMAGADKPGRCILLKAPRAGHGKTHLLTRLQHELGGSHEFIPLHATGGSRIDAVTALDDTLRRLVRALPAAGGLTLFDLVVRRLFSSALQPLVNSGEVPCQDREGALAALRNRPIETFDFHHPAAVTAHWARENFELLGPRLALELSQRNGLPLREISFWVETMFRFAATPIDNPGRARALAATVFDSPSAEAAAHERLIALLGLLGSLMRVVLVADELEGFSADEAAALRFASFIGSLRQSVERADVILSVNQDIWESAFLPRLSGGLADRLSEITVELEPLDRAGMLAIIESRSPGMGEEILAVMGHGGLPSHARGIVRKAGESWGLEPKPVAVETQLQPVSFSPPILQPEPVIFIEPEPAPTEPEAVLQYQPPAAPETTFTPPPADPLETPTRFSPEAAIAAFNAAVQPETGFMPPVAEETFLPPAPPQPAPAFVPPAYIPPVDSPFIVDTGAESAVQAFKANPDDVEETGGAVSTDRVDDLLRQFRERYGKG